MTWHCVYSQNKSLYTYNLRGGISYDILVNMIKSIKAKQQKGKATEQPGYPPVPTPRRRQNFGATHLCWWKKRVEKGNRRGKPSSVRSLQSSLLLLLCSSLCLVCCSPWSLPRRGECVCLCQLCWTANFLAGHNFFQVILHVWILIDL